MITKHDIPEWFFDSDIEDNMIYVYGRDRVYIKRYSDGKELLVYEYRDKI